MNDEIRILTKAEAIARLPDREKIHTYMQNGFLLFGVDRPRAGILALLEQYPCEESGPRATRMGHGLVLKDDDGLLFIETREEA